MDKQVKKELLETLYSLNIEPLEERLNFIIDFLYEEGVTVSTSFSSDVRPERISNISKIVKQLKSKRDTLKFNYSKEKK